VVLPVTVAGEENIFTESELLFKSSSVKNLLAMETIILFNKGYENYGGPNMMEERSYGF